MRKHIITALLAFCILMLWACQATPEGKIIHSRDYAESSSVESITPNHTPEAMEATQDTQWNQSFQTPSEMPVEIEANIELPNASQYPIVNVEPIHFTAEQIEKIAMCLSKGRPYFSTNGAGVAMTKEEAELTIIERKKDLTVAEQKGDSQNAQQLEKYIAELEALYPTLLTNEQLMSDGNLVDFSKMELPKNRSSFLAFSNLNNGKPNAVLEVFNNSEDKIVSAYLVHFYNKKDNHASLEEIEEDESKIQMSQEEAIAVAEKLVSDMGFADMKVVQATLSRAGGDESDDAREFFHTVILTREFNKIAMPYVKFNYTNQQGTGEGESDAFRGVWESEHIRIDINDSGICEFQYVNPVRVTGAEKSQTIMNFDDIKDRSVQQIGFFFADRGASDFLKINRVEFGMQDVPIKDDLNRFQVIPCWVFYGNVNGNVFGSNTAIMVLSAIDGSVIR